MVPATSQSRVSPLDTDSCLMPGGLEAGCSITWLVAGVLHDGRGWDMTTKRECMAVGYVVLIVLSGRFAKKGRWVLAGCAIVGVGVQFWSRLMGDLKQATDGT